MSPYSALAQSVEAAQSALRDALEFASRYCLGVSEAGVVTGNTDRPAQVGGELRLADGVGGAHCGQQADQQAAGRLRVITRTACLGNR